MSPVVRRVLYSLAVLVWAGVLLYFYGSGRVVKYLAPDFRVLALVGGLGLGVMGCFNLLMAGRVVGCGHDHDEEHEHEHEGGDMGPVMVLVLMVVPVVCAAGWTRDVFSEATLARKGLYADVGVGGVALAGSGMARLTREDVERGHRRTGDGFLEFSLMELFFATGDPEIQGLMDGLRVETEGRVVAEKVNNEGGTRMRLYRMFMTCCVADARAIPIVLEFGGEPPVLPENGWVRVGGRMTFPEEDGVRRAVLVVERAMAAEVPAEEKFFRQ